MEGFVYDGDSDTVSEPFEDGTEAEADQDGRKGPRLRFIIAVMLVIAGALAGLAVYAAQWKKSLWIKDVVISGNRVYPVEELMQKAEGVVGKNLDSLDSSVLINSYTALPYVKHTDVIKELNGIVRITLEERIPMALTANGDKVQVIDTEGYILPFRSLPVPLDGVPRVSGIRKRQTKGERLPKMHERSFSVLSEMIQAVAASEYARLLIRQVALSEENNTYFTTAGSPTRFIVGNGGNYKEKLKKFEIFWQKVVAKKGLDRYATVDLRFRDRVFAVENSQ